MTAATSVRARLMAIVAVTALVLLVWAAYGAWGASAIREPRRLEYAGTPAMTARVNQLVDQMMDPAVLEGSSPIGGLSSNPYDYTRNNAKFEQLVALGPEALPVLEAELAGSADEGLREYMLCIAIEDIAKCDLKQFPESKWDRASGFSKKWTAYLDGMPERTLAILEDNLSPAEKARAIKQLGAPAVPFVADRAASLSREDDAELTRVLVTLVPDAVAATGVSEFAANNRGAVESLRRYVKGK